MRLLGDRLPVEPDWFFPSFLRCQIAEAPVRRPGRDNQLANQFSLIPNWDSAANEGAGITAADLDGDGRPKLIVFQVEHRVPVPNRGLYTTMIRVVLTVATILIVATV